MNYFYHIIYNTKLTRIKNKLIDYIFLGNLNQEFLYEILYVKTFQKDENPIL